MIEIDNDFRSTENLILRAFKAQVGCLVAIRSAYVAQEMPCAKP